MNERDHAHTLPSGETVEGAGPDGVMHVVPRPFRFMQGLRPDLVPLLDARPDLCARLWRMALWAATPEDLDAAIEGLLAEPAP